MKRLPYKQLSKLLSLTLMIVLLTMSFSGCFGNSDPTEPSDELSVSTTEGTEATDATEEPTAPPETEPEVVMGTVNTDKLNVRTKANPNSPSVKKLAVGTRLEILEQLTVDDVTWGRIEAGWVNMKYVDLDGEASNIVEDPGTTEATVPEETTSSGSTSTGIGTNGTVTANSLYIRKGPGTKYDSVGKLSKGDKVQILEKSGNWGKTADGWVSLKYIDLDGDVEDSSTKPTESTSTDTKDKKYSTLQTDGSTKALGTAEVTTSALNVRYGPSTDYEIAGKVYKGENVTYYQKSGNWIRIKDGWISVKYVDMDGSSDTDTKSSTGTVTASSLRIRKGPGTDYDSVGSLKKGEKVEILEQKKVDGVTWGRISSGWICLDYVDMD